MSMWCPTTIKSPLDENYIYDSKVPHSNYNQRRAGILRDPMSSTLGKICNNTRKVSTDKANNGV